MNKERKDWMKKKHGIRHLIKDGIYEPSFNGIKNADDLQYYLDCFWERKRPIQTPLNPEPIFDIPDDEYMPIASPDEKEIFKRDGGVLVLDMDTLPHIEPIYYGSKS